MTTLCAPRRLSVYATGRDVDQGGRLLRPGGLALTARAVAFAGLGPAATVLDLGCGSGESVRYLQILGIDAIGIDRDPPIERASTPDHSSRTHIVASAENLPIPGASVEGVLAECSLSLMKSQHRVLSECARVLIGGGRLMISDLYARQPSAIAQVRALGSTCVSGMIVRDELESTLALHGFTIDLWEDHSQALRECAARFIFEHDTLDGLWQSGAEDSAEAIQSAMRAARAGYFLLIATLNRQARQEGGWINER